MPYHCSFLSVDPCKGNDAMQWGSSEGCILSVLSSLSCTPKDLSSISSCFSMTGQLIQKQYCRRCYEQYCRRCYEQSWRGLKRLFYYSHTPNIQLLSYILPLSCRLPSLQLIVEWSAYRQCHSYAVYLSISRTCLEVFGGPHHAHILRRQAVQNLLDSRLIIL